MSMSIIKNIQFMTDDGNSTHVISIEDARKLYEELHELFGPTPVAVAPSEPYNPLIGPNPLNPWVTGSVSKGPNYPIGSTSGGPLTASWAEWSATATSE